jgi:hypothetical protein
MVTAQASRTRATAILGHGQSARNRRQKRSRLMPKPPRRTSDEARPGTGDRRGQPEQESGEERQRAQSGGRPDVEGDLGRAMQASGGRKARATSRSRRAPGTARKSPPHREQEALAEDLPDEL